MSYPFRFLVLVGLLALVWATPAQAGPRDFVISMSGFLGTTEQAQPVLAKLFRQLESDLGWPVNTIDGAYYPEAEAGLQHLKQSSPGFAVVTHQMYFEHHKAMKMQVIAGFELADGAMGRFHLVTKKEGGPSKINELVGRTIASPHLAEILFAEKIIFGGRLSLSSGGDAAKAISVRQPLSALRKVLRGQADAALVDEPVVGQLSSVPEGSELQVIYSSELIPPLPVVALGGSNPADRGPMTKALTALCNGPEGAALCESLRVKSIRPASDRTYADIIRKMGR